MSGVSPGSPVTSANTNQAFIDANGDDFTIGKLGLQNSDTASGSSVVNTQEEINSLNSFLGKVINTLKNALPAWVNNDVGISTDSVYARVDELTQKFNNIAGHAHDNTSGNGAPVQSSSIAGVTLNGVYLIGVDLTAVTGGSSNVSSQFSTAVPSTNSTTKGVVVNSPYNRCILQQASGVNAGDKITNGSGHEIYGRLTKSGSIWTLTYYVSLSGVETAYTFASSKDVRFFFQQLFNPIVDFPVYSELAITPSENATADVVDATETQAGKVLLSNIAASDVSASASTKGTGPRVSQEGHTHQGVRSLGKYSDITKLFGDIDIEEGSGITITRTGQRLKIDSQGGIGFQEIPGGTINGVNDTFGPLAHLPSSAESCLVMIDGLPLEKYKWSLTGYSITITDTPSIPVLGQEVYVFYLSGGVAAVPPTPSGTLRTEFRTVSSLESAAKKLILAYTPAVPGDVLVDIIGGTSQEFNVDYTIVSNELRWNGYALDGVTTTGDKFRVHYIT